MSNPVEGKLILSIGMKKVNKTGKIQKVHTKSTR